MAAPRLSPVARNVTQVFNTGSASGGKLVLLTFEEGPPPPYPDFVLNYFRTLLRNGGGIAGGEFTQLECHLVGWLVGTMDRDNPV